MQKEKKIKNAEIGTTNNVLKGDQQRITADKREIKDFRKSASRQTSFIRKTLYEIAPPGKTVICDK